MKFTIKREELIHSLQLISGVVEKRHTMPVLANVLLDVVDDGIIVTGTNTEVELIAVIKEVEVKDLGKTTVPAKKFFDICRALPANAMIDIELKDSRLNINFGKSHFVLSTLPAEHFPNVEEEEGSLRVPVEQKVVKSMIDATGFAMAQQDVRYYLNGMLLEVTAEGIKVIATDGHRMALTESKMDVDIDSVRQFIIPRKGVLELSKLMADTEESCELVLSDKHIRCEVRNFTFTSKLIDGKFPDYRRVIPRGGDKFVIADRVKLKEVLSRASILSHESIRGVRMDFHDGEVRVHANNPDQEEAQDSMEVEYDGELIQIGFNVSYLIDVLNVVQDSFVKFTLSSANSSTLLEGIETSDKVYVVMPMRL